MTELSEYRAHRLLQLYIPPFIIILGTFGNVFAFVILKNKAMLKFSTYFFLMVMSIADTLVLYAGLLPIWIGQLTSVVFRNLSNWACKMNNVIGYTVSALTVLTINEDTYLLTYLMNFRRRLHNSVFNR